MRSRSGTEFFVNLVSRPAVRPAEAILWHTAIVDLSSIERADEARRKSEAERLRLLHEEAMLRSAAAAKDRFLAVLSHELRTPLTPILLTLGTLEAQGAIPPDLREPIAVVRRNIELEARLIDDLLDTTRIVHGKLRMDPTCVDVHAIARGVFESSAVEVRGAGIELITDLAAPEHHVLGDALRLRQVLTNLLGNAIRHTPVGGRITVASYNCRAGRLGLAVRDTGAGIGPELLPRVFEDDGATRAGLGLGLAIARGIVEAHGGRITARSEGQDRGTTIELELDTVEEPRTATDTTAPPAGEQQGLRILLVEDDHDSAVSLCELLGLYGHRVTLAESCTEALQHRGESFDLLVTDIGLPDGDGLELRARLDAGALRHSIALSGYGSPQDVERSRAAGFDCHLTKPVGVDELLGTIERLADRPSSGTATPA